MLPKKLDNCLILAIQILQFSLYYHSEQPAIWAQVKKVPSNLPMSPRCIHTCLAGSNLPTSHRWMVSSSTCLMSAGVWSVFGSAADFHHNLPMFDRFVVFLGSWELKKYLWHQTCQHQTGQWSVAPPGWCWQVYGRFSGQRRNFITTCRCLTGLWWFIFMLTTCVMSAGWWSQRYSCHSTCWCSTGQWSVLRK